MKALTEKARHSEELVDGCRVGDVQTHVTHIKQPSLVVGEHSTLINHRPNNDLTDQKNPRRYSSFYLLARVTQLAKPLVEILLRVPNAAERFPREYHQCEIVHSDQVVHHYLPSPCIVNRLTSNV